MTACIDICRYIKHMLIGRKLFSSFADLICSRILLIANFILSDKKYIKTHIFYSWPSPKKAIRVPHMHVHQTANWSSLRTFTTVIERLPVELSIFVFKFRSVDSLIEHQLSSCENDALPICLMDGWMDDSMDRQDR